VFFTKNARCLEAYADCTTETITIQDCLFAQHQANTSYYCVNARPRNNACQVNIIGTKDPRQGDLTKCTAVLSARQHAFYTSGGGALPIGNVYMKNAMCDFSNDLGTDARPVSGGAEGKLIEDCIFSVKTRPGCFVDYCMTKDSVYNRDTFYMKRTVGGNTSFFYLGSASDPYGIKLTDCVIAGTGLNPPAADPSASATATPTPTPPLNPPQWDVGGFIMTNCAIATSGADAITTLGTPPTVQVTYINCKFVDPMFLGYNGKLETFLDTGNPALAASRSDGAGLGGGAHFRGLPDASEEVFGQPINILKAEGDCEADLFRVASGRGNWGDPIDGYGPGGEGDIYSIQDQVPGIVGNADWVHHASGRLEAGSSATGFPGPTYSPIIFPPAAGANTDGGSDVNWSFYYKIPTTFSSYPRIAIRIDPNHPPFLSGQGEVGACAHKIELWIKTSTPTYNPWIVDSNWHLKTVNLATGVPQISQTGFVMESTDVPQHHDANVFVNNYLVPSWFIDEIYLTDASGPMSGVADWALIK
jgi:hypothetical protein